MRLPPALLALTTGDLLVRGPARVAGDIGRAAGAGLRGVLVREPTSGDAAILALFDALARVRAEFDDLWLGLHDRAHLAALVGADGLHLGYQSLSPTLARPLAEDIAIGLSTHAADEQSTWRGADYLFHGPIHDTPSKRGKLEPIGTDGLAQATGQDTPVWALGGIEPADGPAMLEAGAAGVAVLRGIFGSPSPERAVRSYVDALAEGAA